MYFALGLLLSLAPYLRPKRQPLRETMLISTTRVARITSIKVNMTVPLLILIALLNSTPIRPTITTGVIRPTKLVETDKEQL